MLSKEQAKSNLHWLINTCVNKGGIFTDAMQVATLVNSVEVYGASDEQGSPAMRAIPSASEQLQTRINNSETQT